MNYINNKASAYIKKGEARFYKAGSAWIFGGYKYHS